MILLDRRAGNPKNSQMNRVCLLTWCGVHMKEISSSLIFRYIMKSDSSIVKSDNQIVIASTESLMSTLERLLFSLRQGESFLLVYNFSRRRVGLWQNSASSTSCRSCLPSTCTSFIISSPNGFSSDLSQNAISSSLKDSGHKLRDNNKSPFGRRGG